MGLFTPDLYRNLAIGFVVGAGLALWQVGPELSAGIAPAAQAATIEAPAQ